MRERTGPALQSADREPTSAWVAMTNKNIILQTAPDRRTQQMTGSDQRNAKFVVAQRLYLTVTKRNDGAEPELE